MATRAGDADKGPVRATSVLAESDAALRVKLEAAARAAAAAAPMQSLQIPETRCQRLMHRDASYFYLTPLSGACASHQENDQPHDHDGEEDAKAETRFEDPRGKTASGEKHAGEHHQCQLHEGRGFVTHTVGYAT